MGKSSDKDTHHVESPIEEEGSVFDIPQPGFQKPPVLVLLGFWVVTSLLAYSMAGEKMPWLTVHMALPMILLAAWAFGHLIDTTDWSAFRNQRGWIVIGLLFVFVPAVLSALRMLLGANPPFSGKSLEQLADTSEFIIALVAAIASGYGLFRLMVDWTPRQVRRIFMLGFLSLLALLTLRTALTASFINYD